MRFSSYLAVSSDDIVERSAVFCHDDRLAVIAPAAHDRIVKAVRHIGQFMAVYCLFVGFTELTISGQRSLPFPMK